MMMGRDDRAEVTHRHTTSDIRGGRFPEVMLPSTIIPSIEAALAEAASKSKVIFSELTASGTDFSDGDTWYQRTGGLIIAQWEFTSGAWAARTLDSAVIANLDASKITTGTLAAGQKITAGDPVGSRVELDSAGLRKYAADGTTVQVDLTGTTAAFSGLITGSEIVGGEIKTATSGSRVEIAPGGDPPGGEVKFYSGSPSETSPAKMWAYEWAGAGKVEIVSPELTDNASAHIVLTTAAWSEVGLLADYVGINPSLFDETATHIGGASLRTNITTLETGEDTNNSFLMRRIFVVDDATDRALLVARYIVAPRSRVIDSAHPLFIWQADEAAGAQLQYTVNGTTFVTIGGGGGGGGTTLFADPNADRLVFWDDSAGAFSPLTASTGLTLTGTDLTVRDATDAQTGIVELATTTEATTGTDTARATTPAGVKAALDARVASETAAGIVELATSAEAVTGTDTARAVTPAGVKAAIGAPTAYAVMASNQANSTVTPASVTALETVTEAGTYLAKYWVCYQAAATTTGIQMFLDHSGTVTRLASTWYTLTTGGAAATGIADQASTLTAQMMEGKGQRAKNVASGPTQGTDTANADQFAVIEALLIVTVSGTLKLMFSSEVAASAVTMMTGTTLTLTKVA